MVTVDPVALAAHPTVAALGAAFAAEGVALFLVGGCVRDAARGETPKDLDFTTPAGVDDIRRIASQAGSTFELGTEFGTVGVVVDGDVVEITQHRAESYDPASRKPDVVAVDDVVVDLARRDFTINAMAVRVDGDPVLVDPFDGLADLAAGLLRCPGDPSTIFSEDPLRIVRLVRFAARLDFGIDDATLAGARARRDRLSVVSVERVTAELDKIVAAGPVAVAMAAGVAAKVGVAERLFGSADVSALPTLVTSAGVESPLECLAAIAVAVGTGELFAQHRFTNATMRDVRAVVSVVDDLVAMAGDDRVSFADLRARIRTHGNTICRAAAMIGAAVGAGVPAGQLLAELAQRPNLATTPLPVNGSDVIAAGIKPGPEIGYVLASLERGFCTNPELDRDEMLAILNQFAEQYMRS